MIKQKGFTLIELVCVIILLGVLSATVFINWPGVTINLGAQAYQLADDLRYTQALSMTKDQRYALVITSSTTYQITNGSGTAILNAFGSTTTTLQHGISFGTLTNLPNNLVAFNSKGIPYITTGSPGTALAAVATIPLNGGSSTMTVSIAPQTGNVSP